MGPIKPLYPAPGFSRISGVWGVWFIDMRLQASGKEVWTVAFNGPEETSRGLQYLWWQNYPAKKDPEWQWVF